ncbi:MAG: class I SAM-dependent methyltransferase [Candidatus Omnitrophica bacterium]|nr:class I SAM-dependent methyltransferase [Candidatus Omnitrophota bacterium]
MENYWKMKSCGIDRGAVQKGIIETYPLSACRKPSEAHKLWLKHVLSAGSVLDFGAGDLRFKKFACDNGFKGNYKTLDIADGISYDYRDISQVKEKFDLILCFEVIEHLPLESFLKLIKSFKDILNEKGTLIITTPNIHHINHFWKTDVTHIRPYPYTDLCAILKNQGYGNLKVYRLVWRNYGRFRFFIKRILAYFLEVDCATNICVIAERF